MIFRIVFAAVTVVATSSSAQAPDPLAGKELFQTYCWQCHGQYADGNGPMAEMLAVSTPNLTELTQRNGGVFPAEAIARQIDGRRPVLAHGGEMPVFGPFLETDLLVPLRLPSGQPMLVGLPLANLVTYLESIQTP